MSAVEVDRLDMRYGDVVAVRGLSFAAGAGEVTCVLGRNGAGKTSTIEALEGLRQPHAGRMSVLGFDPQLHHAALVLRVGVMLQEVGLPPAVRVGELARCTADLYPASLDVDELLDVLDLQRLERRTIRQLSGGEKQRLALALALVGRPQVVFLDEPTAGVDQDGREVVREIIGGLRDEGVCVVLTTHDLAEAERVADRFIVIDDGELRAEGTLDELRNRGGGENEVRFRAPEGLDTLSLANHLGGWQHAQVTEISWGEYRVAAQPTPALISGITSWLDYYGLPLADLRTGRQSLEELFMLLVDAPDSPPELVHTPAGPPRTQSQRQTNVRRPITGQTPAFGRPPTSGQYPTVARRPVTGQTPAVGRPSTSGEHPTVGRPPGNGRAPISGQYPTVGPPPTSGQTPVVGRRPTSGDHPTVGRPPGNGRAPISGQYPTVAQRPTTGQTPAVGRPPTSGEHPTVGRPPGNGRALTSGEHPVVGRPPGNGRAPVSGEHPTVGRPPGNGRAPISGQYPTVGRRPVTGQTPAVGGSPSNGEHPTVGRPAGAGRAQTNGRPPLSGRTPAVGGPTSGQHPTVGRPPGARRPDANGRRPLNGRPPINGRSVTNGTSDTDGPSPAEGTPAVNGTAATTGEYPSVRFRD